MKSHSHRLARYLALATVVAAGTASNVSYACSAEDYISTICVLAAGTNDWRNYAPADGRVLSIAQYTALFSLLGTTYGGNGQTTFALPDLRGRFLLGAGNSPSLGNYTVGQVGGTPNVTLTVNNMPIHTHSLAVPLTLTNLTGTANLAAITGGPGSVSMTGVTFNADTTKLTLQANSGNAATGNPSGGVLSVPAAPPNHIYTTSAPNVSMAAGTVGGSITVTASGNPTLTLAGTAPVTVGGATTASGNTGPAGGSQPFSIMPPYLAMYYVISINGIYPSRN